MNRSSIKLKLVYMCIAIIVDNFPLKIIQILAKETVLQRMNQLVAYENAHVHRICQRAPQGVTLAKIYVASLYLLAYKGHVVIKASLRKIVNPAPISCFFLFVKLMPSLLDIMAILANLGVRLIQLAVAHNGSFINTLSLTLQISNYVKRAPKIPTFVYSLKVCYLPTSMCLLVGTFWPYCNWM